MRLLLTILVLIAFLSPKAQTRLVLPPANFNYTPAPQWQLTHYTSLSAGYTFFRGGGVSYIAAPFGLQLSHPLTKNIYAFTGVSASPVFFSMNRLLTEPGLNAYPANRYGLGVNGRVEAGLMYINDAKTFSVSGSISVERGSYPIYPSYKSTTKQQ